MAKTIMIQGTMSNVGKSFLVAGLCRIFQQDGYKVAPFKSQNMALNSFITKDGLEMGRAQVMQAEAAIIEPDVMMNPILLKPTSDMGSQVIVNGKVFGNMSAGEYFKYKKTLIPDILKAYNYLANKFEIIVIEGAGSPAEINLKTDDIVNMGLAKMLNAPVILVGDIDRGGVFAQLIGTISLFEEWEKSLVKGTIINKFRGDKKILDPGLKMLEDKSSLPVLGVIPYSNIDLDDEDSLTERFSVKKERGLIDIVVIKLPRISNFTDFNNLEIFADVSLRYIKNPNKIGTPDMIIIPGTKNTISDLLWLRQIGLESIIKKLVAKGTLIFGICGGFQMLGEIVEDPHGVECLDKVLGMGLLPIRTKFSQEKIQTRTKGTFNQLKGPFDKLSNLAFQGYEIHMGQTILKDSSLSMTQLETDNITKSDGACYNNIAGTYVHGIFENEIVLKSFLTILFENKGLDSSKIKTFSTKAYKNGQYDILAQTLRENLDLTKIYELLGMFHF